MSSTLISVQNMISYCLSICRSKRAAPDAKGTVITVHESNENTRELRRMFEELSTYRSRHTTEDELLSLLDRSTTYSPMMRFILEDEDN